MSGRWATYGRPTQRFLPAAAPPYRRQKPRVISDNERRGVMTGWDRIVEDKIQRAIEEGVFDDLPGKGRPLNLDEAPFEDSDMRLAHHLLRSSGYTLPWIAERQEIENDIRGARSGLLRSWQRYGTAVSSAWAQGEWQRALDAFRRQVEAINARIRDYNLVVPVSAAQRQLLDPEREVGTITAETGI
jgi:hypothetical protein